MTESTANGTSTNRSWRLPDLRAEGGEPVWQTRVSTWVLAAFVMLICAGVGLALTVQVDSVVKAHGTLRPKRIWFVRAREAGTIETVHVSSGDSVEAGTMLASLDTLELTALRAGLRAELANLRASEKYYQNEDPIAATSRAAEVAEADARLLQNRAALLERMTEFGVGGSLDSVLTTPRTNQHIALDRAIGDVLGAEAQVKLRRAGVSALGLRAFEHQRRRAEVTKTLGQIQQVDARMRRARVIAPHAGIIISERLENLPGRYLEAGDPILEIGDLQEWEVEISLREQDVQRIATGQPVVIRLLALDRGDPGEYLEASISHVALGQLDPEAFDASTEWQFGVTAVVAPQSLRKVDQRKLRPGFTAETFIVTGRMSAMAHLWHFLRGSKGN